ncbi:MAG: nucleotidyl transferase AbiEii/AbiGii toxin family protein [Candidatus Izemoplasmatales bacterium]
MKVIDQMLQKYDLKSIEDRKHAIKEILQEIVLSGLARTNFFSKAAFYGGTALRIFYGLNRFSEDLDFTLLTRDEYFSFDEYISVLNNEVESLGLKLDIQEKLKSKETKIKSVFVKGNTKEQFLVFYPNIADESSILHADEKIKVKFEIDIDPPKYATTELKNRLLPFPYQLRVYDLPSLFAGKIDAVLSRSWKQRIKGRDFYDYIFFLAMEIPVNLKHLKERLVQSKYINKDFDLNQKSLIKLLNERFIEVDYIEAKKDVIAFVENIRDLDLWSSEFFINITKDIKIQ